MGETVEVLTAKSIYDLGCTKTVVQIATAPQKLESESGRKPTTGRD
jgi:hypothetical protein